MRLTMGRWGTASAAALLFTGLAAGTASSAPADVERYDNSFAIEVNGCLPSTDFVETLGQLHLVTHARQDGTYDVIVEYHGKGIGQPSGTEYVLNYSEKFRISETTSQGSFAERLISRGQPQNLLVTYTFGDTGFHETARCTG
jgi:hypothetical protein